jgi:hypothetical protein
VLNGVTNGMSAAPEMTLKLGDGDELRGPLGAVLVGGMATSTFLSLLYVPVTYTYVDSFGVLISRLFSFKLRLPLLDRWGGRRSRAATETGASQQ